MRGNQGLLNTALIDLAPSTTLLQNVCGQLELKGEFILVSKKFF